MSKHTPGVITPFDRELDAVRTERCKCEKLFHDGKRITVTCDYCMGEMFGTRIGNVDLEADLRSQRDGLLAALKRIMKHYGFIPDGPDFPDAWAAINKAEKGGG